MVAGLCSCSVPPGTGNGNENENANDNENGNGGADLVVFEDPDSDFSTTDVMDVNGDIVRLDGARGELIWVADGTTDSGWEINGNVLGADGFFTVAFGTENGERGAYFTETDRATICDLRLDNGEIKISATNIPVPQE
jgi:hypothetical protein